MADYEWESFVRGREVRGEDEKHLEAIAELIRAGKKIEAVKNYRKHFGTDLKTSKEAVDELTAELRGR